MTANSQGVDVEHTPPTECVLQVLAITQCTLIRSYHRIYCRIKRRVVIHSIILLFISFIKICEV